VSGVSTIETDLRFSGREDFWIIVAARSEDETETRAGKAAGGRSTPIDTDPAGEVMSVRDDFLMELRGFGPLISAAQAGCCQTKRPAASRRGSFSP
jgi:hypothetical protein